MPTAFYWLKQATGSAPSPHTGQWTLFLPGRDCEILGPRFSIYHSPSPPRLLPFSHIQHMLIVSLPPKIVPLWLPAEALCPRPYILVCSGGPDWLAETTEFSQSSGGRSPRSGSRQSRVMVWPPFLAHGQPPSCCVFPWPFLGVSPWGGGETPLSCCL